ncbi:MAG: ribonuclease G [Abditibacteriaceae bacterium]
MEQSSHGTTVISPALPAELPDDLRGFNWGAFFLQWIWGIRHKVKWAWWALIPGVNIVIAFKLGFQGQELAWKNCEWKNEVEFDNTQLEWTRWGIGVWIIAFLLLQLAVLLLVATNTLQYDFWRYITPGM